MPKELVYDLLVHPFFSLAFSYPPGKDSTDYKILSGNAKVLNGIWRKRILEISKDPNRGIVIIRPDFESRIAAVERAKHAFEVTGNENSDLLEACLDLSKKAMGFYDALYVFSAKKLGERCVPIHALGPDRSWITTFRETFYKHNLKTGHGVGNAMGEYNDVCVKDAALVFTKFTGQKLRLSVSRGTFLLRLPGRHGRYQFSDLTARQKKVLSRARNIFSHRK